MATCQLPSSRARSAHMVPLPSWLLVGDKALAKDKAELLRRRVRYIVNCTPPKTDGGVANYFPHDPTFEYLRVELRDVSTENILPLLPQAVAFLQRARVRADGRALVHCNEGKSRSVAVAAGFLCLAYGSGAEEAIEAVKVARPHAQPKEAFVRQLRSLTPATLESELDGFEEPPAAPLRSGPPVGPQRPTVGPQRPPVGPQRPTVGPAPRPGASSIGASAGPSEERGGGKRSAIGPSIGPEPPPKRAATIGPSCGPPLGPAAAGTPDGPLEAPNPPDKPPEGET